MPYDSSPRGLARSTAVSAQETRRIESVPHFAQVSELAYRLWKDSGFADGTELEYWYEAEQQLFAEESARVSDHPRPA